MASSITPEQMAKSGTEHGHQTALFIWAAQNFDKYPQLRYMFAIPNGGQRHAAVAGKLKAEGVKAGVPDIFLAVPIRKGEYHQCGLFIELKIGRNTATEEQKQWLKMLNQSNYTAIVCHGWEQARDIILEYLK